MGNTWKEKLLNAVISGALFAILYTATLWILGEI